MNTIEKYKAVLALAVGLVVVFFGDRAGVTQEQLAQAVLLLVSYILGVKFVESRFR